LYVFSWVWLSGHAVAPLMSALVAALGGVCVAFFVARRGLRFYVLFELSLLPTVGIVLLFGYQPEKLGAGRYLLLYTALRSLPLLLMFIVSPAYLAV